MKRRCLTIIALSLAVSGCDLEIDLESESISDVEQAVTPNGGYWHWYSRHNERQCWQYTGLTNSAYCMEQGEGSSKQGAMDDPADGQDWTLEMKEAFLDRYMVDNNWIVQHYFKNTESGYRGKVVADVRNRYGWNCDSWCNSCASWTGNYDKNYPLYAKRDVWNGDQYCIWVEGHIHHYLNGVEYTSPTYFAWRGHWQNGVSCNNPTYGSNTCLMLNERWWDDNNHPYKLMVMRTVGYGYGFGNTYTNTTYLFDGQTVDPPSHAYQTNNWYY